MAVSPENLSPEERLRREEERRKRAKINQGITARNQARKEYAKLAMMGLIASMGFSRPSGPSPAECEHIANAAFKIADAMMSVGAQYLEKHVHDPHAG